MHFHRSAAIVAVSTLFLGVIGLPPAAGRKGQLHEAVYREPVARAIQRGPIATGLSLVPDPAGDPGNRRSSSGVSSPRQSSQSITRAR
jgi:hypothetical protein